MVLALALAIYHNSRRLQDSALTTITILDVGLGVARSVACSHSAAIHSNQPQHTAAAAGAGGAGGEATG